LPNAIINNRAYQQPGDGQSELTLAAFGNIVVAGFNDCTGFANPDLRNGAVGWAFSTDGAQTWRDLGSEGRLQKVMSTDWGSYADPSLAVDSAGNFYFSKLYSVPIPGGFTPISIAVHKGYFDPNTARVIWGPPTVPFAAPPGTAGADKPHIAVDPNTSGATATVYLAFTDFNAGQVIRIVRSVDGASTWSAPITLSKPGVPLGAIPRVGPIGEIYVAWERNWAQPSGQAIMIAKATAWPSFSSELVVSNVTPLTRIPSFNPGREPNEFPTMGVDTRGRVYIAWNDGRYGSGCPDPGRASDRIGAILLTYSPDGLSNWSSFAVVNDDGFPSANVYRSLLSVAEHRSK
jgi:hypothetical protein